MFTKPKGAVVVTFDRELSDKEIDTAIASMPHMTYHALVQLLDGYRHEAAMKSATYVSQNNAMASSGEIRVYEALTGLINDLSDRRTTEV